MSDFNSMLNSVKGIAEDDSIVTRQFRTDAILEGRDPKELIIMCGDIPVMAIHLDIDTYVILDKEHLPYLIKSKYKRIPDFEEIHTRYDDVQRQIAIRANREAVISWLAGRTLLLSRKNAKWIYNAIGMNQKATVIQKAGIALVCRAVSIMDNYWVKLAGDKATWESINIRRNHLNETIAQIALHGKSLTIQGSLCSPEFTTNGVYAKAWRRYPDSSLWLHKLGAKDPTESKIEIEVSNLLNYMNVDHVPYIPQKDEDKFVCACPAITSDNLSIISASDYMAYLTIEGFDPNLEIMNVDGDSIYKMFIVDYLISNRDRHGENWGFMYNPDTMDIIGCHPLFDHNNAFSNMWMDDENIPYQFNNRSIKENATVAMRHVDFHFTKEFKRNDFLTTRHYETFMQRANQLGIRVIPETPQETLLRIIKRELLFRNHYEMCDTVLDMMPKVGIEMSEKDIEDIVKSVVDNVVPKIVINN